MKREDALMQFNGEIQEDLKSYSSYFWDNLFTNREKFLSLFKKSIQELEMIVKKENKECMYIYCFFLRQDISKRVFNIYLQAVDNNYIFDQKPVEAVLNIDFLFQGINSLWGNLIERCRKYIWKVNEYDVNSVMLENIILCHWKITFLLRFMLRNDVCQSDIHRVLKKTLKIIRWGEYRDRGETVYRCEERRDNYGEFEKVLKNSLRFPYRLQNSYFLGGNYKKHLCQFKNLQYATFKDCKFDKIFFDNSNLTGTRFIDCLFIGCSFEKTIIHLVSFDCCEIKETLWKNADFYGVYCRDTFISGLTKPQEINILHKEEEFNEKVFFYGARQNA